MIEILNQYGQAWAEFFGFAILQNTLFLGIIFLILYWLRDANASTRYTIAMIGIIKLLLPPFLPGSLLSKWFSFPGGTIDVQIGKPMVMAATESVAPTFSMSLIGFLFLTWLFTIAVSVLVPVFSSLRLRYELRDAKPIRFDEIDDATVKILQSEKISMPLTIGFLLLSFGLLSFTFSSSSPPNDPVAPAVQKTGKVYGNIKDNQTGKPIEGAKISIKGTDWWAASDDEGNYFIINVPPGVYNLEAGKDAYKNVIVSKIEVKEALSTKIDFMLEPVRMKIFETGKDAPPPPPPPPPLKEKSVKVRAADKGDDLPPPPPPPIDEKEAVVKYDNPPEVVGGFGEIKKVLKYPERARKAGVTGMVYVDVHIDERGKIVETKILQSLDADCDQAAVAAITSVSWKPALKDKKPVAVWITVPVKFALK